MKTFLPLVLLAALLHAEEPAPAPSAPAPAPAPAPAVAESKPHAESAVSAEAKPHAESAESAESGSPAGGAGERSEPEGVSHAESAESAEPKPHAESAESAEPAPSRSAEPRAKNSPLRAEISLIDGSILKGALRQRAIPARSRNLGDVRVRLDKVETIAFGKSGAPAKIAFANGDALAVRFPADRAFLAMDTAVGPVRIPFDKISSLSLSGPPDHKTTRPQDLLYYRTFDNASSVERPAAGPSGVFLGGSFVPGKKGNALRVEKDRTAFEAALPKGFLGPEGCIEFWAKIEGDDPRYVDGGDPLFFSLFDERGAVTLLQFAANNGFARGGLGGAIASWPFGTVAHWSGVMPYEGVLGPAWADWHHYAMSWKAEGFGDGTFVKVFVDGKPQPVLGGVDDDKVPARLADLPNHEFLLGFPWGRARVDNRRSKKPFLVDEFRIWKTAKTEFAR